MLGIGYLPSVRCGSSAAPADEGVVMNPRMVTAVIGADKRLR
jgi:hypothetical protein